MKDSPPVTAHQLILAEDPGRKVWAEHGPDHRGYPGLVSRILASGKLPVELLRELLESGPPDPPELRVGPRIGEDACALDLPAGTLVAASDPITLTGADVGAHAVVINANDVAVMGVRPRWFLATILLPDGTDEASVRGIFRSMRQALEDLDVTLVGGHTEVTSSVVQPIVVGQMMGLAENGNVVLTAGANPGDRVVQVGPVPVEGAAVLALEARDQLGSLDAELLERAANAIHQPGISVVDAALAAARLGATSLHDPTEGGLAAGLIELAEASEVRLRIDPEAVLWFEPGLAVCRALGADPWATLASGALLATFTADRAPTACAELQRKAAPARVIGSAEVGSGVTLEGRGALRSPERDEVARVLR